MDNSVRKRCHSDRTLQEASGTGKTAGGIILCNPLAIRNGDGLMRGKEMKPGLRDGTGINFLERAGIEF